MAKASVLRVNMNLVPTVPSTSRSSKRTSHALLLYALTLSHHVFPFYSAWSTLLTKCLLTKLTNPSETLDSLLQPSPPHNLQSDTSSCSPTYTNIVSFNNNDIDIGTFHGYNTQDHTDDLNSTSQSSSLGLVLCY